MFTKSISVRSFVPLRAFFQLITSKPESLHARELAEVDYDRKPLSCH
jgi:hypothetical protein